MFFAKQVKSAYETAIEEFFQAVENVKHAQSNFNNALPEFFEIANSELTIAQMKCDIAQKKVRQLKA